MQLLTKGNPKLNKSVAFGYLTTGLSLAPHKLAGGRNLCPGSSAGCRAGCLNTAGMGGAYPSIQRARIAKTRFFFEQREQFMVQLVKELAAFERKAAKHKLKPVVRLNILSDVLWENERYQGKTIFEHFPAIQFMDYTKIPKRMLAGYSLPPNYHLTFSRSEENEHYAQLIANTGGNVAVVFAGQLPKKYYGRPVINGDKHDLRFLDRKGSVIGLIAKGRARRDESGFVVK